MVYDGDGGVWRPALVTSVDAARETADVFYTESDVSAGAARGVQHQHIRRRPTNTEIEACARACGRSGRISVGNCPTNTPCECECALSAAYAAPCNPSTPSTVKVDLLWNIYDVNSGAVALQKTGVLFGIPSFVDGAAASAGGAGGASAAATACGADPNGCKEHCDKLANGEESTFGERR